MVAPVQASLQPAQLLTVPSVVLQPAAGAPHLAKPGWHWDVHTPPPQVGAPITLAVPQVTLQAPQLATSEATERSQPLPGLLSQSSHSAAQLGEHAPDKH